MDTSNPVPALLALCGRPRPLEARVHPDGGGVEIDGRLVDGASLDWDVPTAGCVYGAALNFRDVLASLAPVFSRPPHGTPPRAPVLYLKPRNTWLAHRHSVPLPEGVESVEIGATLGIVIGRDASRVAPGDVQAVIAGYTIVNDVTIPHSSLFRPPLRYNCRDGFCPIGPWIVPRAAMGPMDSLGIRACVNGEVRMRDHTSNLHRNVAQLIVDVTEFMTLRAGDVLTVGVPGNAPLARAGDLMAVEIDGIGRLENRLVRATELHAGSGS